MPHKPEKHVCDHLRPLEDYLMSQGVPPTSSGQVWSMNCRFWIYFKAVLDCDALRKRFERLKEKLAELARAEGLLE
jgi:hypothetical protein